MNYYCAKFYTNISTNLDTTNIFQFLSIFAQNFYYFYPPPQKKIKFWTYSAWHHSLYRKQGHELRLCKISCFHDLRNFPLAITNFMCCKLALPRFLSVEHCPPCIKTPLIQIMSYIYTHLWYRRLVDTLGGGQCFIKLFRFWLIK